MKNLKYLRDFSRVMDFYTLKCGIRLHYHLTGLNSPSDTDKKPLLVMFHGFGSGLYTWESFEKTYANEFIMLAWEHRGHGDSDKPVGRTYEETLSLYTMKQICEDAHEIIHGLIPNLSHKYFIIGHSMGGMMAQLYALMYHEELAGMILESTAAQNNGDSLNKILDDFKSGKVEFGREAVSMNTMLGTSHKYRKEHPEIIERSIQYKLKLPKDVYIAFMENIVKEFNLSDRLYQITIPTLIMHGDRDALVPITRGRELHQLIKGSKFIEIPKGPHSINAECSEIVIPEIRGFINQHAQNHL
jgi:pimeloyl-ACP methyl ester carboxylesterase